MKKIVLIIVVLITFSFNPNYIIETYSLTLNVNDLRNSEGLVQFTLYNKDGSIPDEKFKNYYLQKSVVISNNSATVTFEDIPLGWYAVNILHDENENRKIDKGFVMPKEGIGFSNYTSIGLTNRPKFEKAKFEVKSNTSKEVKVIYF
jgi:uncharacterized protein (DUF2141 family)